MLETSLAFVVFGRPQGKGSKRVMPGAKGTGYHVVDSNRNARPWANQVSDKARLAMADAARGLSQPELLRGAVSVELTFYFLRPKSHYGSGRNSDALRPSAPEFMTVMPDVDKLARCALDALTGVVIADDAQVARLVADKRYGGPERLVGCVREL